MPGSKALTLDGVNAISDALVTARNKAFFVTMSGTGLRVGELTAATIGDVLTGDRRLRGSMHIPAKHTKGKKRARSVPLPMRAQTALATWISQHPAPNFTAPLFPSQKFPDRPVCPRQMQRIIKNAATAAGVEGKITPHSARKFFGTSIYINSGHDINAASQALGHSTIAATPAYLDLSRSKLDRLSMSVFDKGTQPELSTSPPHATEIPAPAMPSSSQGPNTTPKNGDCEPWPSPDYEPTANSQSSLPA